MKLIKKSLLLFLFLLGVAFSSYANEVAQQNGKTLILPQSYQTFFPQKQSSDAIINSFPTVENIKNPTAINAANPRHNFKNSSVRKTPVSEESSIYGYLYYYQSNDLEPGFYQIDPGSAGNTLRWIDFYTDWGMYMTGGWLRNGRVCGLNSFSFMNGILSYNYVELDFNTGEILESIPLDVDVNDMTNIYVTIAYRDLDDRVYGYGYGNDGESMSFNSAPSTDIDASQIIRIVDFSEVCTSLCYNVQTDLFYGVNTEGKFVSVDKNGIQTVLFDVDVIDLQNAVTGIVYNPDENNYTWNVFFSTGKSAMYCIDPIGETATKISDCASSEEYIFMVNTRENAAPAAPAVSTINNINFVGISTDGTITATLPNKTQNGSSLSDNIEWQLFIDGNLADQGSAAAGSTVIAQAQGISNNMHVIAFTSSKNGLRSIPAIRNYWVGADYPVAPENVVLTETNVSWNPVSSSVHGGYVNYSDIKYTVYLNDNKVGETSDTSLNITMPEGKPYQSYTAYIVASVNGKDSEKGASNYINYGEPLKVNTSLHWRPEEWELPLFKAVNVDGRKDSEGNDLTWCYTEEMAFPSFASGYNGDDWLFFPPIEFDNTEKAYKFVMEAGLVHDSDTRGVISVHIGKEPTPEAMTQVILPDHRCEHMRGDDILEYFAVNEPGVYYIGIHAITYSVSFHISDMDIAITDRDHDVPLAVTDLSAVAADNGKLSATVTFKMPEFTSNGDAINANTTIEATISSYPRTIGSDVRGEMVDSKTISGAPGSIQSVVINTAQSDNVIGVVCSINGKNGREATINLYTGVVRPYIVQNLKAEVTEDNMGVKLTWTPPVEGEEDGAIGDDFFYTIWYYNNSWEFGDGVGWNELEYTYRLPEGREQQWVRLGIMAYNPAGQSDHIVGITEVIGTPYELPIIENFPDYYEEYEPIMVQRPSPEYENTYWYVDDPADILSPMFANDSGIAYIGFVDTQDGTVSINNAKSRLSLPKFSTKGLSDVKFTFSYFGGINNKYAAQFYILADAYGFTPEEIAVMPKGEGWITNTASLPEKFNNKNWVELLVDAYYANDQEFAMFTSYSVSGNSSIDSLATENEGKIYSTPSMLHISGFKGQQLLVTDLAGRTFIKIDTLDDFNGFALAPGIYIVKAGVESAKVLVK